MTGNISVSAHITVAEDRCPVSLSALPCVGPAAPPSPHHASVRFRAVPWGNFDLERMRVTDLAAAQGLAVSLRPGLGCPCYLSPRGTPSRYHGLGGEQGSFLAFLMSLVLIHYSLLHSLPPSFRSSSSSAHLIKALADGDWTSEVGS